MGVFLALLGILNLTTSFIGGGLWTVIAFVGAASSLLCARELRKWAGAPPTQ
jgi:hypothetical protein